VNASERRDRPLVAIAEPIEPVCLEWLERRCRCRGLESIQSAAALIVRTATRVDRALLASAHALRVVGRAGVGLDHIDLGACAERGIVVVHTPDANTDAVVEYVFAEMLDAIRRRPVVGAPMSPALWEQARDDAVAPMQLNGAALGVLGFGRIGSRVGAVGRAFGMRVRYHDLREIPTDRRTGAEPVGSEELLGSSEFLTIHVDGRASNRGLIGARELGVLKHDAVLINTSRGLVVDAGALADFLGRHPGARAVCDVHEPEPIGADNPLLGLPNARLTPHIASATSQAKLAMSWVVRDVWRALSGETPEHQAPIVESRSLPAQ
jgi:phosphoglycerate dehydrogenase-like enzyme